MNKTDLLKEMKESIGTKDPEVFFTKMTDVFSLLFDELQSLNEELTRVKLNSAMAIHWDERIALKMIDDEIQHMRLTGKDPLLGGNIYQDEINAFQMTYMGSDTVKSYTTFCKYWQEILGYHPFLEARQ